MFRDQSRTFTRFCAHLVTRNLARPQTHVEITMDKETLLRRLRPWGQAHLLAFWEKLDQQGRQRLGTQIQALDLELVARLYRELVVEGRRVVVDLPAEAHSPPALRFGDPANAISPEAARAAGCEALEQGKIAVLTVAGGQGTRLRFRDEHGRELPKGMYPIGPISGRSLFQIHAEKIAARRRRHRGPLPWLIMTSPATDTQTRRFFGEQDYFGLGPGEVEFFCQGTIPAVDARSGKILLEAADSVSLSPDGHGGTLAALARSGLLGRLLEQGVEHLFYFQVDNPLVDVAAPEFLGYHLLARSEMSTQVIRKRDPLEKVGNVVQWNEHVQVIEYFDLPAELARQTRPDGSLRFWAGSIAVHAFSLAFLKRMAGNAEGLPFHAAHKRVAWVDPLCTEFPPPVIEPGEDEQGKPARNAVKFERLIFDLLPAAQRPVFVEIDPAEGFAPLKDAPGEGADDPPAVQAQMIAQHRRWLSWAGAHVAEGAAVEICPLWALDAEEVAERITPGVRIEENEYFH